MPKSAQLTIRTVFLLVCYGASVLAADFETVAERTGYRFTATYDETVEYFCRLDSASAWIELQEYGVSPQGRTMHVAVISKDRAFDPESAHRTGKVIMLIQNGIHSGEIDGKDACMALLRDIAITRERESLLDSVILLVIPIFNLDGHENNERFTRANQFGPENAGFRATSQILNLNRDYLKADAPEMRAWLQLWRKWMPDYFVDDHVTDGADWQYTITYTTAWHPNSAPEIRRWAAEHYDPFVNARVRELGFKMFPYAGPRRGDSLESGVMTFVDIPRFSTGYTTLWNRPGLLVEMHSLKEYRPRVLGNYAMLVASIESLSRSRTALKAAIRQADSITLAGLREPVPLTFEPDGDSVMVDFEGYEYELARSEITGGTHIRWDTTRPRTYHIPYFGTFRPRASVMPPRAYLIPRQWMDQVERLRLHGIRIDTLIAPFTGTVAMYRLDSVKWAASSFEGHVRPSFKPVVRETTATFPSGTFVIDMRQPGAKVALQALEPGAPDSYVAWGLWNTIFEQKEYIEDYMIDPLAEKMYRENAALRAEFDARRAADTAFARDTRAKRDFFYKRSTYSEPQLGHYPVARLMSALPTVRRWSD